MAELTRKDVIMLINGSGKPRLAGVDLSSENLIRLDFEDANLRGANLQAAKMNEAIMRNTNMTGVDMTGTQAPYADFHKSLLIAGNLTLANLNGARLTEANLTNTILNGANLTGANLKGANVTGVKFDEATIWPDGKKGSSGSPVSYTK